MSHRIDELKKKLIIAKKNDLHEQEIVLDARIYERQLAEKEFKEWLEETYNNLGACDIEEIKEYFERIINRKIEELGGTA